MINWKTAIYGNRVWAKDYEGYLATNPKVTTYIGNYFEVQVEGYVQPTGGSPTQPCRQTYCAYFPYVANIVPENISYYYADGERIAMKNNGLVSYLYGDQPGSISAIVDVNGNLVSKTLYHPWGTTRYTQGTNPTNYAYTGQMREGDIYFYNARWYDPIIGRFMQADTIVPVLGSSYEQGAEVLDNVILQTDLSNPMAVATSTQWNQSPSQESRYREYLSNLTAPSFDRFGYGYNNPLNFIDPSGHSAIPEDSLLSDILNWAKDNLKLIWRNPPTVLERVLF